MPIEVPLLPLEPGGEWLTVAVGLLLLAMGRRLYWLSWVVVGFVMGIFAADRLVVEVAPWVELVLGLVAGVVLAALAIFLQKLALALAGFVLGGFSLLWLFDFYALDLGNWEWGVLLVGAVLCGIALVGLFDVALIVLSSFVGAGVIVEVSRLVGPPALALFLVLLTLGIAIQTRTTRRRVAATD